MKDIFKKQIRIRFLIIFLIITVLKASQPLPDFKLKDLNNNWITYEDLKGDKLTIIDFWATWCAPCIRLLPQLNIIYEKYHKQGVNVIGINIDAPRNDTKIKPFVKIYKIKYPILKDPTGSLSSKLDIVSIPELLIVNSKNEIVYRHVGYFPGDENLIEQEIEKMLNKSDSDDLEN